MDLVMDDTPLSNDEVELLASFLGHAALNAYCSGTGTLRVITHMRGEGGHLFSVEVETSSFVHPQATVLLDRYRRSARVELL